MMIADKNGNETKFRMETATALGGGKWENKPRVYRYTAEIHEYRRLTGFRQALTELDEAAISKLTDAQVVAVAKILWPGK